MATTFSSEEESLIEITQCSIEHLQTIYHPNCDEETLDDLTELFENLLQCCGLLDSDLFHTVREVVSTLIAEKDGRMIRGRGRPSIITNEEQVQYLVEQGFGAKEIGDMFNCSKRTVERKVKQCFFL